MQSVFTVVVVLLVATFCAPSRQEEHLVPKHGLESRHSVAKRDLSEADVELILKALVSKMEHSAVDTELMHKKIGVDKEHYSYKPERMEKSHFSSSKDGEFKHLSSSYPIEHEYMTEKGGYGVKKDLGAAEMDMMALLMKIKELGATKGLEDSYKKEVYYGTPEEKFISGKAHFSKDPVLMEKSGKMFVEDKFSDKDVSLAESLYHMKMAGDIETYPSIKLEPLSAMHDMKMGEEKLYHEDHSVLKAGADEAYLKKVDEIGKSLLKEETYPHLKNDDIEGYLKKVAGEEKSIFYDPKIAQSETVLKSKEEKAVEAWKAGHKDLFATEGGILLDDKMKTEGIHHSEGSIAHGISDEMMKKLKASLGLDKELVKGDDELLLLLSKELHKEAGIDEGSHAYEKAKEQFYKDTHIHLSEEELKKYMGEALAFAGKEKSHGTALMFEKGLGEEKIHGISPKMGAGIDKSFHGLMGEEAFKSKEGHAFDESFGFEMDKSKFGSKIPMEGGIKHVISHEIPDKFAGADKEFKIYEEELLKKDKGYGSDSLLHKALEEELLKKEKAYGTDAFLHKAHEEEFLKEGKGYGTDAFLHKAHEEEFLKKEKAYGTDASLHKAHEEELLKEGKGYGTDAFLHKSHEEELLKKEKAYGTDSLLHKAHEEELLKKEKAYGTDALLHKAHEEELLKKEKAYGTDDMFKAHDDELMKKEIAYGSDGMFHKKKEILETAEDHHIHHGMKDKEMGIFHGVATDKHHEVKDGITGVEKSRKTFQDLKAKFFELLRRVLHMRKCHLVTMRPGELLGIVNCISRSKDPMLCEKFAMCEKKMPSRVIAALEKCQKETVPGEVKRCTRYAPLYPSTEIPLKIFQCVAINTRELMPEEKKHMIEFEECARVVKAESCSRFKFLPRPH